MPSRQWYRELPEPHTNFKDRRSPHQSEGSSSPTTCFPAVSCQGIVWCETWLQLNAYNIPRNLFQSITSLWTLHHHGAEVTQSFSPQQDHTAADKARFLGCTQRFAHAPRLNPTEIGLQMNVLSWSWIRSFWFAVRIRLVSRCLGPCHFAKPKTTTDTTIVAAEPTMSSALTWEETSVLGCP